MKTGKSPEDNPFVVVEQQIDGIGESGNSDHSDSNWYEIRTFSTKFSFKCAKK